MSYSSNKKACMIIPSRKINGIMNSILLKNKLRLIVITYDFALYNNDKL